MCAGVVPLLLLLQPLLYGIAIISFLVSFLTSVKNASGQVWTLFTVICWINEAASHATQHSNGTTEEHQSQGLKRK